MKKTNQSFQYMMMSVVFAIFAMAARGAVSENFEALPDQTWVGSESVMRQWTGMAHVQMIEPGREIVTPAGYPQADVSHDKALQVIGSTVIENTNFGLTKYSQVEYLQEVVETLDTLTGDELDDVQIAVGTGKYLASDSNRVELVLFCLPKNAQEPGWVKIGDAPTGTYMRVNLAFDYSNQTCRVSINGIPRMTNAGYLLADKSTAGDGAWYRLAAQRDRVNNVQFVGIFTQYDDVTLTEGAYDKYAPFPKDAASHVQLNPTETWTKVPLNDLNRWGIDNIVDTSTISLDKSGLSVKDKLELGYDPQDGKRFVPTAMSMNLAPAGNERVTLTFPKAVEADDLVYSILATGDFDSGAKFSEILPATRNSLDTATQATSELPLDVPRVLHFKLRAERRAMTEE